MPGQSNTAVSRYRLPPPKEERSLRTSSVKPIGMNEEKILIKGCRKIFSLRRKGVKVIENEHIEIVCTG